MAWWSSPINPPRPLPSRPRARLRLLTLEERNLLAAGGGFTNGGLVGEYFANPDLSGTPAFTRTDVRIDFDWQGRAPGGSTSPDYAAVPATDFSVRWTGQIIPKFSELYTFRATGNDGIRVWVRPSGSQFDWTELVNDWDTPTGAEDDVQYRLFAGQTYDIKIEYRELAGSAVARLAWSSPSTPTEVIEPAVSVGVNAETYQKYLYADSAKTGRVGWGDPVDYFGKPPVATDAQGWPTADAGHLFWDSQDPTKTGGTYLLQFQGQAEVSGFMGRGRFSAGGVDYGQTLPVGAGYDPATNTTTALVTVDGTDLFGLNFVKTQRTPADPVGSGITDVQFMRPSSRGSDTPYQPGELFATDAKQALSRFTTLRYLTANFNDETNWSDRKLPGDMQAAWGDQHAVWENEVMLANETGKDLYITLPVLATADYITNLANLMKYGSDGVNPYTSPVANPVYPGLNPNLRVYVEWGNEIWNFAFAQGGWAADADRAAVLTGTPEGQIVNFDGKAPEGDFRRWAALKTVEASNIFRSVWGDAAMGEQVRVVYEYQYDNVIGTAVQALKFIDQYFNNGDGIQHVADPHPVNYYLWGAGAASYFGAGNPRGLIGDLFVPGGGFEAITGVAPGTAKADPAGSPWVFTGTAGVYRDAAGAKPNSPITVPGVGTVPATPHGSQAMYVAGTGTATLTITFPRAGVYAIDFQAAGGVGPTPGNTLDFYLNGQRVTPNGSDPTPPPYPWWAGNGNRDSSVFSAYGTVPVQIPGPGKYTFQIVGRGTAAQTTVIDNVRVESLDAIFASRIPAGGQAAGQVSQANYQAQLAAQARYALAYGLKVVAYEGGWSLGGDHEGVPIQGWAKYYDPRTAAVMGAAIDAFYRAGGELNVLGTYDQWYVNDAANAGGYPIVQGIDARLSMLPAPATIGQRVPGTAPIALLAATGLREFSQPGYPSPGDWVNWIVVTPIAGNYRVAASAGPGGTAAVEVDGAAVANGPGGKVLQGMVHLSAGVHAIRVQSTGGRLAIRGIVLDWVNDLPAP